MTAPFEKDLRRLLDHLCVQFGFCLPPEDNRRLIRTPPADAESFTDEVFVADGFEPRSAPPDLYRQVLDLVTAAYDQTSAPHPSTMKDLQETWHRTRTHLTRALDLVSNVGGPQLERFHGFLEHNELEQVGEAVSAPADFWSELRSAAEEMRLADHHERLHRRMREAEPNGTEP